MTPHTSLITEQDATGASNYLLKSPTMEVIVSSLGATIRSIRISPQSGTWVEVTQGFDDEISWLENGPFFGSTVGRVANRIAQARFELDGKTYQLPANDGSNHLHGGAVGFHLKPWKSQLWDGHGESGVLFTLESPDGEGGYPGRLSVSCRISLTADNVLKTVYEARSDRPTPVNMTNHTYFNLGGPEHELILDHELQTGARHVLPTTDKHLPDGTLLAVAHTPFDFGKPKAIGKDLALVAGGYDHCFVLEPKNQPLAQVTEAARVSLPSLHRTLRLFTDQSGFQFYSGNYLAKTLGRGGKRLAKHGAFCLESQRFPDSPNHPEWASITVTPDKPYRHEFHYALEF